MTYLKKSILGPVELVYYEYVPLDQQKRPLQGDVFDMEIKVKFEQQILR